MESPQATLLTRAATAAVAADPDAFPFQFVDVGKKGPSVGDTFADTIDIKSQAGVDLGTERTQCVLAVGRWAICTAPSTSPAEARSSARAW
jgi:hypothetical protein